MLTADIVGLLTDVGQREAFRPWGAWAWWGGIRLAGGELRVHESFSPYFSRLFVSAFHYHLLSITYAALLVSDRNQLASFTHSRLLFTKVMWKGGGFAYSEHKINPMYFEISKTTTNVRLRNLLQIFPCQHVNPLARRTSGAFPLSSLLSSGSGVRIPAGSPRKIPCSHCGAMVTRDFLFARSWKMRSKMAPKTDVFLMRASQDASHRCSPK